jgi:DNA-binding PadR family transcriptional regulator
LVSLSEQTGSGYELTRRFDRSIGYFFSATHQQIYRTLRTMEGDGWVQVTPVAQQGRPDKKVYAVTDAGRSELTRWIAAPLTGKSSAAIRDLALKLRGAVYGDLDAVREQMVALRAERASALEVYRSHEKQQFPDPSAISGATLHQHLVLRGGIRAEQSSIEWLDEALAALGG